MRQNNNPKLSAVFAERSLTEHKPESDAVEPPPSLSRFYIPLFLFPCSHPFSGPYSRVRRRIPDIDWGCYVISQCRDNNAVQLFATCRFLPHAGRSRRARSGITAKVASHLSSTWLSAKSNGDSSVRGSACRPRSRHRRARGDLWKLCVRLSSGEAAIQFGREWTTHSVFCRSRPCIATKAVPLFGCDPPSQSCSSALECRSSTGHRALLQHPFYLGGLWADFECPIYCH